jgi:beta-lactamase regulating signal transducer with metallopeptidase domain
MTSVARFQSIAEISAAHMLNSMAEGIGIALFAWILLRIIRKNSGTRFAIWFVALLTIAALPVFGTLHQPQTRQPLQSEVTIASPWAFYLFIGWLVIAALGLARVGIGLWQLRRLRKSCKPADLQTLDPAVRETLQQFESSRPVALCVSDKVRGPTAIGFSNPLVIIPSWVIQKLSPIELRTVLLHELAHVRRWDDWTNLAQRIVSALLFFHPAVWWIQKRLSLEREMACDDVVLSESTNPRKYAECLVRLAENSYFRRGVSLAQAAVSQFRHISLRLHQILDKDRPRATRVWKPALFLLSGFTAVSLAVSPFVPRLVSFADTPGTLVAAGAAEKNGTAYRSARETRISSQGAHIIPTKLNLRSESDNWQHFAARHTSSEGKDAASATNAIDQRVHHPALLKAKAGNIAQVPGTVLLVVQTEEYGGSGLASWNLTVWRVVLLNSRQSSTLKIGVAKAI